MTNPKCFRWTRRDFLSAAPAVLAGGLMLRPAQGEELPTPPNPRATAGDVAEPNWESRRTLTVGPNKADLVAAMKR